MGLQPNIDIHIINNTIRPSKTYKLDFERKRIYGYVDGQEAVRQYILKTLLTKRFQYLIYNDEYGIEISPFIDKNLTEEYIESRLRRAITEALIYDYRISSIDDFTFEFQLNTVKVTFIAASIFGNLYIETSVGGGD